MDKKVKYYIDSNNEFVIENYNLAGAFSNFLPGIAGLFGIPMWVFYVNRGQAVCSFGVNGKDSSIMEFFPANRAYQLVSSQGFRTFLKIKKGKDNIFYEPFKSYSGETKAVIKQRMFVSPHELRIEEINSTLGLSVEIKYFTIPNQPFAGLVRIAAIKNISKKDFSMETLDGTPMIIPYGTSNFFLQKMRRTIEAWMFVENMENNAPFYRLKADPKDASEVKFVEEGNFYLASISGKALPVAVDPEIIFGHITDFSYPVNFVNGNKFKIPKNQMNQNKLPSAMAYAAFKLKKGAEIKLYSLLGHMSSKDKLNSFLPELTKEQFFVSKREENKNIIDKIQDNIFTVSADKKYNTYCGQTFLDNVLRGGIPITCSNHYTHAFYVYSRKHGDLERDYNKFSIEPAYFSQGDGNYRDTNQNRRNDVFFNPDIKDFNILHFYSLIQADGYNPLVLKGVKFKLKEVDLIKKALKDNIYESDFEKLRPVLSDEFTPGKLFMEIERLGVKLKISWYTLLDILSKNCVTIYDAEHGEGYWVDHWTYNLDLVESFLGVYPDKLKEVLLDKKEFTFYDNVFCVKPRSARYLLKSEGVIRQYHSLEHDARKTHLIKQRAGGPHLMRTNNGEGDIYKTTLLVKMLCIAANKISSLDPFGIGIEMEADKPGWCDSMNGLPGLCGSSTPEVFELKRQVVFILDSLKKLDIDDSCNVNLPEELRDFIKNLEGIIKEKGDDFYYWDKSNSLKEEYRHKIKFGFSGIERTLSAGELKEAMNNFLLKIDSAVKKAYDPGKKAYTTYFINEVVKYELSGKLDPIKELPLVKPTAFKNIRLPLFLEGPVRALKIEPDAEKAKVLCASLKKTKIYDTKLKMYKINEPLEGVSKEVGRSSIFTTGWLENESVWLHMEYKYLLEILKKGLYEEFFENFKNTLIPFQKPERYGRSIFENSSFIVSSAFPDAKMHGRGFVARLSGSTAEMLNIWLLMSAGKEPFSVNEKGGLNLRFSPALPSWLFTKKTCNGFPKNTYAFKFLGSTLVVYHNPKMKDTVGKNSAKVNSIVLEYDDGRKIDIQKDTIGPPYSLDIRDRKVKRIDIQLS
ncbi:MAG: hypothetical protein COW10_07390 [Candidatus Omnitrophica bacterium CG12_big_fil_rev_8_21_14_0_65_42_8]|nr:MAG: hypothetical protein COW10_07390 [Candidatus Omnitrophica bacterium CG12_big_fil_rev_8_21_14_0_65_42_8]